MITPEECKELTERIQRGEKVFSEEDNFLVKWNVAGRKCDLCGKDLKEVYIVAADTAKDRKCYICCSKRCFSFFSAEIQDSFADKLKSKVYILENEEAAKRFTKATDKHLAQLENLDRVILALTLANLIIIVFRLLHLLLG